MKISNDMRKILFTALTVVLTWMAANANASTPDSLVYKVRAGYSIGGTAPIGIPATIRSIDAYRLTPSFMVGGDLLMPLHNRWKVMAGLRIENKGMDADVTTKSYRMEMKKGDSQLEGLFTGHISQKVTEWMVTIPVQMVYVLSDKVMLKGGPYVSMLLSREFSGIASDGYLRQGSPTGPKIEIGNKEGEWATYDFSDDMRHMQWGIGLGVDWQAFQHFGFFGDLNWGLTGIFDSDFKTVEQTLYPIYGTIGAFYRF